MPAKPKNAKRRLVLEAARQVFLQHGFAVASVDEITRRAGVSKATVYAHFPSKDDLLSAVVRETASDLLSVVDFEYTGDPKLDLRRVAGQLVDLTVSPELLAWDRLVSAEAARSPELGRLFYEAGPGRIQEALTGLLEACARAKTLAVPDAAESAEAFFGLIVAPAILRNQLCGQDPPVRPTRAKIARGVDLFLKAHRVDDDPT